jgi:hypothetical protein
LKNSEKTARPDLVLGMTQAEESMEFIKTESYIDAPSVPADVPRPSSTGSIFPVFVGLKACPVIIYMFGWIIIPWTVFQWVFTILAAAADFWFTKNVAGRLILGMRWSNKAGEDGESKWVFEYAHGEAVERTKKRKTFWICLYAATGVWGFFGFFCLIRLSFGWLFVCVIGFSLAGSNTWGFMKCDRSITREVGQGASALLTQSVLPFLASRAQGVLNPNTL